MRGITHIPGAGLGLVSCFLSFLVPPPPLPILGSS